MSCHPSRARGRTGFTGRRSRLNGFTLVELLVVIAIIGVLVALLLPAVQAAREAANRMSCSNNLKQLGIGLHNHHDTLKRLPPGGHNDLPPIGTGTVGEWGSSWFVFILPYMEQGALHDKMQFTNGSAWGACATNNHTASRNVHIPFYFCPSSPLDPTCRSPYGGLSTQMAPTYVGISGAVNGLIPGYTESRNANPSGSAGCCSGGIASAGGTLVPGSAKLRFASLTDGLSNTLVVSENGDFLTTVSGAKVDWRASAQHGWIIGSPYNSPPPAFSGGDQRTFNMTTIRWPINDKKGKSQGSAGWPDAPGNCGSVGVCDNASTNLPLNSAHPGGVMGLMGDGSVRFISETTTMAIVAAAATRDDGQSAQLP
jgi:prepilin-type N-terminal cleavage/methylation domain-containing protein